MQPDWGAIYADVEDFLIPGLGLSAYDRSLYYHLLRHTRLKGQESAMFAIGPLSKATGVSDFKVREVVRDLHQKGCLRIEDRTRLGHKITVLLPTEIPALARPSTQTEPIDLLAIDFFSNRQYLGAILARESGACFYCLKKLTHETCELDHVSPQKDGLDNSYKNIAASCHGCNKAKGDRPAEDFIRSLYRSGALNEKELQLRLAAIESLRVGHIVPELAASYGS
ncbi:MAG: HNH endonuclease signature motif containing protein [Mizugakiibacter sp.]|uniref:HNH endonuclease signature motif containing protein n=1 Tax=Mizugakiibacter sp. TaxID=1972610 RepID=UPI0031CB6533|nr:HNH endonuclease [Xanthomonadaceae bacterium]